MHSHVLPTFFLSGKEVISRWMKRKKNRNWEKLPMTMCAITGSWTEIYRPLNEPHYLYFSEYHNFHCMLLSIIYAKLCGFGTPKWHKRVCYDEAELDFPERIFYWLIKYIILIDILLWHTIHVHANKYRQN